MNLYNHAKLYYAGNKVRKHIIMKHENNKNVAMFSSTVFLNEYNKNLSLFCK